MKKYICELSMDKQYEIARRLINAGFRGGMLADAMNGKVEDLEDVIDDVWEVLRND